MLWNKWQGVILRFKKCQIWQKKLRLEIKKIVRFERCQRRELELQTSQLLWRWYLYDEKNGDDDDDDDANNDDENNDDEFDRKMWLGWRSSWRKWSCELRRGRARRERWRMKIGNYYFDRLSTFKMMMTMMTQVRAEVSERLEGLVSSIADLRAQFEGTLARVSPHSTTVMAMLTSYFLHTR